jgi:hypothetical protein
MSCEDFAPHLDDFIDGELDDATAAALAEHLRHCSSCRDRVEETRAIVERAAELPRSVAPQRDLWPPIEARIDDGSGSPSTAGTGLSWSSWLGLAAAATLFLAVLTGSMVRLAEPPDRGLERRPHAPDLAASQGLAGTAIEDARDRLLALLDRQREAIPPDTMAIVDGNLAIIGDTVSSLRRALARDPDNTRLSCMLVSAYEQEIELLRRAVLLPDEG